MIHVLVLHSELAGDVAADAEAAMLARLPYGRRLELERRDSAGRLASLAGLALALDGVRRMRGHPADPARLRFAQDRAPALEGGPLFSVSHSRGRVGVALCDGGAVGFDLEDLAAGSDSSGRGVGSLERWTAIEAVLKAGGTGLREAGKVHLSQDRSIATLAGGVFHLRPLVLAAGCVACLATGSPVSKVIVEEIPIPWPGAAGSATD